MNVRDAFHRRYRDVDALVVGPLFDAWRHTHDQRQRANIETALGRLQDAAQVAEFGARRFPVPPPQTAAPHRQTAGGASTP